MTDIDGDTAERAHALRADACARLARAEELRREAEAEECAAWRAQAQAAVIEAGARRNAPARRRPRISGDPKLSGNRVITLMDALCIDEHVNLRDGLDRPLRLVEARLGICYARRGTPTVGTRIDICERALDHSSDAIAA